MRSSCDLKFSGFSNNLREVSGTVFISLNCCKSTALSNSVVVQCFRCVFRCFFRVRSHALVRPHARGGWTGV